MVVRSARLVRVVLTFMVAANINIFSFCVSCVFCATKQIFNLLSGIMSYNNKSNDFDKMNMIDRIVILL